MGYHVKLLPRECSDCGYSASGGAFKRSFLRWWYGDDKCPKCKSKNIIEYKKPKMMGVPATKVVSQEKERS